MERMKIIPRIIESRLRRALERQKSVLLLGPRQTGKTTLVEALLYGRLPGIVLAGDGAAREEDLRAYTTLYLEEEVRAEALVRNLGTFSRFLQLAALEAGNISHFRGLAQELGVPHTIVRSQESDYLSLTDIARYRNSQEPFAIINNWMRSRSTIEFLGLWEKLSHPGFKPLEFERFKSN